MRIPKTVRGYMSLFRKIDDNLWPGFLQDFEDLPEDLQKKILDLSCYITNEFNEIEAEYYELKEKQTS